jgi:hypothetical protein
MGGHSRRAAYAGCRMIPYDRGADRLPNRAYWWRGTGSADRALPRGTNALAETAGRAPRHAGRRPMVRSC